MKTFLEKTFTKNKKGSHVDWAISMGIFLVYIIGMFILLRPGITPVYKPEGLLEILENEFSEEVMWEVKEIPIILQEDCRGELDGERWNGPSIELDHSKDWKFSDAINPKPTEGVKWGNGVLSCSSDTCERRIKKPPGNEYDVVYYPTKKKWGTSDLILDARPSTEGYCDKVTLGASTTKVGVNDKWLAGLRSEDYEKLKEDWDFPDDKEFSIYYGEDGGDFIKLIGAEEPLGINVFTKEFKTQYVNQDGGITIPLIINLRAW